MGFIGTRHLASRTANFFLKLLLVVIMVLSGCLLATVTRPAASPAFALPEGAQPMHSDADTTPVINELQQRVEDTTAAYNESLVKLEDIEQQIANNREQVADISGRLGTQREKSSQAAAELYRMQRSSNTLLELLFSAQSFSELAAKLEYINRLQESYYNEIMRLSSLSTRLDEARTCLVDLRAQAQAEATRAEEALNDARAARDEARRKAEETAAAQARAASMPVATPTVTPVEEITPPSGADLTEREEFIAHWGARVDAYLEMRNSLVPIPMVGYGKNFAAAAFDYNVDPRVAVAISTNESGNGRLCFLPHNAWGWGQYSWPDWPTAIEQYTAGFSRGYGYTIDYDEAPRYVGTDNYPAWYQIVIGEMNQI